MSLIWRITAYNASSSMPLVAFYLSVLFYRFVIVIIIIMLLVNYFIVML